MVLSGRRVPEATASTPGSVPASATSGELGSESGTPGEPAAVEASRLFSAYRLQVARQARGLSKSELSKKLGISAAALSQFELGQVRPSPGTVQRLSDALDFAPEFFSSTTVMSSSPQAADEVLDSFGHFRSLRSVTAARRRKVLTVAHLLRDVTVFLESQVKLPDLAIPWHPVGSPEAIPEVAAKVRAELGVDHGGPVDNVLRMFERHGVVCARFGLDAVDVSAFSVPLERRAFLVLKGHRQAKVDRDRFSACHELAHLVLHQPGQSLATKDVEREANDFAAEFLMPADVIRSELPSRVEWPQLLQLKQRWGVSMGALLYRAKTLDVMGEAAYMQAMRTMSARGWRHDEPGTISAIESPALLSKAMSIAGLTAPDVAAAIGWPVDMVAELISESRDVRPSIEI